MLGDEGPFIGDLAQIHRGFQNRQIIEGRVRARFQSHRGTWFVIEDADGNMWTRLRPAILYWESAATPRALAARLR